ncbi:unnamed protein product [Rhodiola kirilowii]
MATIQAFLAICAARDWPAYQMDTNFAFLHGDLNEEIYMSPPPGSNSLPEQCVDF